MSRPTGPVPPTFVTLAERGRRRETPTERQIRGDAPAAVAADMLAAIWRHPDRFPGFSRATRIERAFRQRHPALEGATVAGLVITPLSLDGAVPAGASEAYVWASQIGGAGLLLWTATTVVGSLLAVGRMASRNEFPSAMSVVQTWVDDDPVDPTMSADLCRLTAEYVELRNALDRTRGSRRPADESRYELRRLALLARKYAATQAAVEVARASGDDSTALVPTTFSEQFGAEFTNQVDVVSASLAALHAHTAAAVGTAKMRAITLPEPRST